MLDQAMRNQTTRHETTLNTTTRNQTTPKKTMLNKKSPNKKMLNTLLIDFDGVITDTETEVFHRMDAWFHENTGEGITLDEYRLAAGSWHVKFLHYLKEERKLAFDPEDFHAFYHSLEDTCLRDLPLMPGVADWMHSAKAAGCTVAIVSSNRRATLEGRIRQLGIAPLIDFIIAAEDATEPKPAPDLYLLALRRAGVRPDEALVLEDSANGVSAAAAANIRVIAIPCEVTANNSFPEAWKQLSSLADLSFEDARRAFEAE